MRSNDLKQFFPERYPMRLEAAKGLHDVFELVRDAVKEMVGVCRMGIDLGLADLGGKDGRLYCSLHPQCTNMIVLNSRAMDRVRRERPELLRAFVFHSLLHEYVRTIGLVSEEDTMPRVKEITAPLFGEGHPATRLAFQSDEMLPFIVHPPMMKLPEGAKVEVLEDNRSFI